MRLSKLLNEASNIQVWLDDERKTPSGKWTHFKTVEKLIPFFKKNIENIELMSLDHDLGEFVQTGYDFVKWLESEVFKGKYLGQIPQIKVHSANPVGKRNMLMGLKSIHRKGGFRH